MKLLKTTWSLTYDMKLGSTQIDIGGVERVEVEAHDVGAFVGDGEKVPGGAYETLAV